MIKFISAYLASLFLICNFFSCSSKTVILDEDKIKFIESKNENGQCTVKASVKVKISGAVNIVDFSSTKNTCDEAKADVLKGIESLKKE